MNAPTDIKGLLKASHQGQELIHESAHLHVTGEADYTDDIPEQRGTLYAAIIKSPVAHGELIGEGLPFNNHALALILISRAQPERHENPD